MPSGKTLYIEGETHYEAGRIPEAFELYRQAIVQILDHEDVLQTFPGIPEQFPQEVIAVTWHSFVGCFRKSGSEFTQEAYPDAYNLVHSFRPSASPRTHPQFKGAKGQRLLKAMQITGAFALAILAWDKGDRSTTAKRYQEALDVAATHPPFNTVTPGLKHLDKLVASEVQQIKENLAILVEMDSISASKVAGSGKGGLRKDVLNVAHTRVGDDGGIAHQGTFQIATDACGRDGCSNRGISFKRCSGCKKIAYCGVECQREDWKKHKLTHH
ncbi:hypothetical protein DFH09DRAFT_1139749 [Mycena vulgaris]|nr:hypothetical protein DFH09DRAFT_1139749 [Mycena vulgaris]